MNLPNKLTVARMVATPIFMVCLMWNFKFHYIVALVIFIAASLTDMFDGKYARKHNMVTDFGKFLDPIADKMLVTAALIGFCAMGIGKGIAVVLFIMLFREFLVSSIRMIAASSPSKKVIAANIWGKLKTVSQMAAIIYILAAEAVKEIVALSTLSALLDIFTTIFLWIATLLAVISGAIYLYENREYVNTAK